MKITENAMSEVGVASCCMGVAYLCKQIPGDTDLPLLLLHNGVKLRLQQAHTAATPTDWMSDVASLFDKMGMSSASCDL